MSPVFRIFSKYKFYPPASLQAGKFTLGVTLVLLLGLAIAGRILWTGLVLLNDEGLAPYLLQEQTKRAQEPRVDLARVQALHLFAPASSVASVEGNALQESADQTALNLTLEGIMLASELGNSVAIIVSAAQQGSYKVGETLPVGSRVLLQNIYRDHVIISNNGAAESLWLYDSSKIKVSNITANTSGKANLAGNNQLQPAIIKTQLVPLVGTNSVSTSPSIEISEVINNLRTQNANPPVAAAKLAEIIQVVPAQANGQLLGYRLRPGVKLKEFVQLGFKENDVVTSVNGIALNDMANLPQLYAVMNDASDVSFSLLRDGQPLTLQITLGGAH